MKQLIATQIVNEKSPWWDNVETKTERNQDPRFFRNPSKKRSLYENQLGKSVPWTWNKVHVVEYEHALGKVALLRRIFNVGPFEVSGSNEVINNQMFDYTNESKHVVKERPLFSL
jgi:penicillin amidase